MPESLTTPNLPEGGQQRSATYGVAVSFVLAVWDAARPPRVAEAAERHERLCRGGDPAEVSPRITAFVEECERRWPARTGDEGGPITGRRTPAGFLATIRPDAATALYVDLGEMSERHGLVLFDPQSGMVKIPSRLSFDADPPPAEVPTRLGLIPLGSLRRRRRV